MTSEKAPERFQDGVEKWMDACFGQEISADKLERGDRLLEEVFELLQSGDYPQERVRALESYVWGRDKGDPPQEVGGVMVTLAAYCSAHGIDMQEAADTELARVWTKVEKIRAKQAAKPTGSALPIATDERAMVSADVADAMVAGAYEAAARKAWNHDWTPDYLVSPKSNVMCHAAATAIRALTTDAARAALAEAERKAVKAAEEGPAGTARALEIILSRLKFDDQTASILKYQLGSERKSAAALKKEAQ